VQHVPREPATKTPQSDGNGSGAVRWPAPAHGFVGREAELQHLKAVFENAASGQGALIMLVGEPGIGKTALCEQLARFVAARGGVSLVGHCYPEVSASVPYQPFVEAFESFARQRDTDTLRRELGSEAREVARVVPAIRSLLQVELASLENPEDDRLRLLSGVLEFLRNIGTAHPLLLVLEDLHDADRGTLDLLLYLARHLAGTPMLVLGTYRDVEVDRAHPLAAALAELRRMSQFERMHLGELSLDDVQRLLATSSQQAVPLPLAELVHHRSGGNALFVHELLRFLFTEGLVERRSGVLRRVGDETLAGQMPEGLRDVVGKRLSRLTPAANQVLSVASVIGREFSLEVLRRVHARPDDELESALEEAVGAAMVEERSARAATITYRFTHAFFQQTLYDEILAPRRLRLHQQVARALEGVHARRLEEHAAELAEQYAFSSDASDLAKAVSYGELAARRATEVFAYGEAARQLERALAVQDLVDTDDQAKRCDLLLALGEALFPDGEIERVIAQVAPDALKLAEALGDRDLAFRACRLVLDCLWAQGAGSTAGQPEYLTWAESAREYASPGSVERVHADLALAFALANQGRREEARALRLGALALARQLDDPEALFRCAFALVTTNSAPQHWDERERLAEECVRWPRQGVSSQTLAWLLWSCGYVQLAQGERARAEELWRQMGELAERTRIMSVSLYVARRDAILALIDGHLEDALALTRRFVERADEAGAPVRGRQLGVQMLLAPALYLGRPEIYLSAFEEYARLVPTILRAPNFVVLTAARAICLAQLGHMDQARTLVGPLLEDVERKGAEDGTGIQVLAILLQAAVVVDQREAARTLTDRLACVAHVAVDHQLYTSVGRQLGDAAKLVGDRASARAYYAQALEVAGKIRFRPELALIHLRLAGLLLEEGDDSAAHEHLDLAIPELRDMRMQPALERTLGFAQLVEQRSPAPGHLLTNREQDVARLLAAGHSNREIADTLVITEGTVEVHVKHILSKLGLKSRAQVAAWAANEPL
jgi:DNA-binding CsgD family transcriptional regulator